MRAVRRPLLRPLCTSPWVNNQAVKGKVSAAVSDAFVDLSTFHTPRLEGFFPDAPSTEDHLQQFALSDDQIASYLQNGFITGIQVLDETQCEAALAELTLFLDAENPHPGLGLFHELHRNQTGDKDNVLMHALGHWRASPLFHDLVWHPAITVPTAQLLAAQVDRPDVEGGRSAQNFQAVRFWLVTILACISHSLSAAVDAFPL